MKETVVYQTPDVQAPSIEKVQPREEKKKEKKRLWVFLVLIPVVFMGDRVISSMLDSLTSKSSLRYSRLYNGQGEADIVLLGNSRGNGFYEPEIQKLTGLKTINLSYNALPVSVGRILIEDYFDRYKAKKVIVDVSLIIKTEAEVINSFKTYRSKSEKLAKLIKETSPETDMGCKISKLYEYNSELFHRSLYYLKEKEGDWILDKQIKDEMINEDAIDVRDFAISQPALENLKVLIDVAQKHGAKVELVLSPYYPLYLKKVTNRNEFLLAIKNHTGVEVKDYSTTNNDKTCFSDFLHLNKKGSLIYLKQLKEAGIL